jgi:hypothetical protein
MKEITEAGRSGRLQEDLPGFEAIMSDMLACFLNIPEARIDAEIEDEIRRMAQSLGLEQPALLQRQVLSK